MTIDRIGRPGLIGLAARTAALAGPAPASGAAEDVYAQRRAQDRDEQARYSAAHQQARIEAAALAAMACSGSVPAAPVPLFGPSGTGFLDGLQRLAELRRSGLLSEGEFTAAKARLLR